jgi:hypothetical protein
MVSLSAHAAQVEQMKSAYRYLVGMPEGKISLRRPRSRRKYNILMHFKEIGCESVARIHLVRDSD